MARGVGYGIRLEETTVGDVAGQILLSAVEGIPVARVEVVLLATDGTDQASWRLGQLYQKTGSTFVEIGSSGLWSAEEGESEITSQLATPGAADWNPALTVDSNGNAQLDVVGEDGKTIKWTAWFYVWAFDPD